MSTNPGSWYIAGEGNQPTGPFAAQQILDSLRAGRLDEKTVCWQEGMAKWLPLAEVESFAAAINSPAPGLRKSRLFRHVGMALFTLIGSLTLVGVGYVYWKESADLHKANRLLEAEEYDEASKLLKSSAATDKLRGRDAAYLLAVSQLKKYASEPNAEDVDADAPERLKRRFQELFQADEGWRTRAKSELVDILDIVPVSASDLVPRCIALAGFLEQLDLADAKQTAGRLLSKEKEILARGRQPVAEVLDANTVREIVGRDASLARDVLAIVLPNSIKPSLVQERLAVIERWAREQPSLAEPLAAELASRADGFATAAHFDLAQVLVAGAGRVCPKDREPLARKRVQFAKARLAAGDVVGVVHTIEQFSGDLAETHRAEVQSILLECSNRLVASDPPEFRKAMAFLAQNHRKVAESEEPLARYLYGAYLWRFESKRRAVATLRGLSPEASLPWVIFASRPIEPGTYPVNREVRNDNVGFDRDFSLTVHSIEVSSADEIAVNITLRNHTKGKQTFFIPMTEHEQKREADEREKLRGREEANRLRSRECDFYLLDDLGNKLFPRNVGPFFKQCVKRQKIAPYYITSMDPGQEWDDTLLFPMPGIGSSSVTFVLAAQPGHRPEVKFADILLRKVEFGRFPASAGRSSEPAETSALVEAPWAKPTPVDLGTSVVSGRSDSSRRREPMTSRSAPEPDSTPRQPETKRPSQEEVPSPKGPLSGTWQASTGATFQIDDDGTTITIALDTSDFLQSFSGTLTRREDEKDSKSFAGTVDAVFRPDAPKRYTIHVTGTLDDPNHLALRFTDWPTWNNAGRNTGKKVFKETLARSSGETAQPRPIHRTPSRR